MSGDPASTQAILAASQVGSSLLNKLIPQSGGMGAAGPMGGPVQIPRAPQSIQAPNLQQPDIGTASPVGVPMAGAMQRPPMQGGVPQSPIGMMPQGMGQPPTGARQSVNPGADPNSLLMLQLLKLMGSGGQ